MMRFQKFIALLALIPYLTVYAGDGVRSPLIQAKEFVPQFASDFNDEEFRSGDVRPELEGRFVTKVQALEGKAETMELLETVFSLYRNNAEMRPGLERLVALIANGRKGEIEKLEDYNQWEDYAAKFGLLMLLPLGRAYMNARRARIVETNLKNARQTYFNFAREVRQKLSPDSERMRRLLLGNLQELRHKKMQNAKIQKSSLKCNMIFSALAAAGAGIWLGIESLFEDNEKYDPKTQLHDVVNGLAKSWIKHSLDIDQIFMDIKDGKIELDQTRVDNLRTEITDLLEEVYTVTKRPENTTPADPNHFTSLEPLEAKLVGLKSSLDEKNLPFLVPISRN